MAVHDFRSQRLYVDAALGPETSVMCNKDQSNYLRNVLRLNAGDEILIFNGVDGEWLSRLAPRGKRECDLIVIAQTRVQQTGSELQYLFAPLKRARLDYVVQKATEMGVASLHPVLTERTVAARVNTGRMRSNVIEAAEQCGILCLPSVHEPCKLSTALSSWEASRILFFADEAADTTTPLGVFDGLERGQPAAVIIGPEGGFSETERRQIRAMAQTRVVSLGPRIMRADTAAVALLALVNATIGDWTA
ncbi:MAG: 16S rRNA (uracil(1498)-N(3))-methyltransferase [Hyphomicrobiaceae bacterium]